MSKRYVWDVETNGLLDTVSKLWCVVFIDVETGEEHCFSDYDCDLPDISLAMEMIDEADELIGHNVVRYDNVAWKMLTGQDIPVEKCTDTLILSRMNNFERRQTNRAHGLKAFGKLFKDEKIEFSDFEGGYSAEMLSYCIQDVRLNVKVYKLMMQEFKTINEESNGKYADAVRMEHYMSYVTSQQIANGWLIDEPALHQLISDIDNELKAIESRVEPELGEMHIWIDKEPKAAQYKKNGEYTAVTARLLSEYFGKPITPEDALNTVPPVMPGEEFQRSEFVQAKLGNQDHLKEFLRERGWIADDWNWKRIGKDFIKTSEKLTTTSLAPLGQLGSDVDQFYTLRARRSILEGWIPHIKEGRLHGDVMDIGAATGRQTHKIIANIPSPKAKYGDRIRKLFICPEDKVIISADGAAYQARVMAHFTKDEEFINEIIDGDIHQQNADAIGCSRSTAKPFFFAWAFGAGGNKLGKILEVSPQQGNKAKEKFLARWPKLAELTTKVQDASERGYLRGVDGRRIQTPESYKAFNYLIQGTEAILMKATIVRINQAFQKEGIEAKQLLFYHDECSWEIKPKDTKRAENIIRHWFMQAPKDLGVDIMCAGDVKVGKDYLEVH